MSKGGDRLVTSFVELNEFIKPLPSRLTPTDEAFRKTTKWKNIIVSDMKSAFFQIEAKKDSILNGLEQYRLIKESVFIPKQQ